jgi:CHAD domain-containing protein
VSSLRGYEHAYARVLAVMESRPGLEGCELGIAAAVGDALGIGSALEASKLAGDLSPTVGAGDAARRIHRGLIAVLEANEEGVKADLDTEFLHAYRVALRRTRSLLGQIRKVFAPEVLQHFQTEFSWFGRLTGPPRDLDVLALALREPIEDLTAEDQHAVRDLLERARQRERAALLDALASERRSRLLADWKAVLDAPVQADSTLEDAQTPFVDVASRRAWRLYSRILARANAVNATSAAADIHQLRIDAKKLRYVVDVIPGMDASHRSSILSSMKKLQRMLGEYNDAEVQERRLLECARAEETTAGVLLAVGRLAERNRVRARALREPVMDQLACFCAADTRSMFKRALRRE